MPNVYLKYYTPTEQRFGIKIYKLCDMSRYTYDMDVYSGKNRTRSTADMSATHATVRHLTRKVEGRGHKLYMHNFFHRLTYSTI
jgi:hypothetical protein